MKKIFHKIHLWLSVPFGIFITLICFAGAMLVFEKEITEWCRPDLYFVKEVKQQPLPLDSLMRRVEATLPDSVSVTGVTISPDAERTYQVSLSKPRRAALYVDQYTGEVKGRSERLPFFDTMFHLHRWLLGSSSGAGKMLVGISTLMLVVILLTGILMWLTNRRKPLTKSLTISFTKGWPRFWHDLHVAGGIYATIFLLALALTGLTWSFSWYRTGFYSMFGVEASAGHGGHGGERGAGGHGKHERGGRPDGPRHDRDGARTQRDSTLNEAAEGRPHRKHHEGQAENNRTQAREAAQEKSPRLEAQTERPAQPETDANTQATMVEPEERPRHDEATEHRGEHRRGGRGRHRHEGDSTGGYARHHRNDSTATHMAKQESEGSATVKSQPNEGKKFASKQARGDWKGRGKEGRRPDTRPEKPMLAQADSASMPQQTLVVPFAHWQKVFDKLANDNPGYRQINVGDGTAGVVPAGRRSLRATDNYDFDPANGNITGCKPYSEQDKAAKVRGGVYTVHVGSWGGLITRIVTFLAALLGATLPLTGYYLWIRRLINKSARKHHNEKAG